ncbi:MAG: hypothetical protein J2P17_26020 [Mycobacterium sp.]|nr:hypothetical protein [Mycobacterium sp.]
MGNPASLLLAQFHAWNQPNQTADNARTTKGDDVWIRHRLAVRHLDALQEILTEMAAQGKNVRVHQAAFAEWSQVVFAWPRG